MKIINIQYEFNIIGEEKYGRKIFYKKRSCKDV